MSSNKNRYYKQKKHNKEKPVDNYVPPFSDEKLDLSLEEIHLHPKTLEALKSVGLSVVRELAVRSEKDLFKLKGFNKKSYLDVIKKLGFIGVTIKPLPEGEKSMLDDQSSGQAEQKPNTQKGDLTAAKDFLNDSLQKDKTLPVKDNLGKDKNSFKKPFEQKDKSKNEREAFKPVKKQNDQTSEQKEEDKDVLKKYLINGKYGFKDQNNKVVIHADYDELYPFKEGLACFQSGDYYGYIDMENNIVIPADTYVLATSFSEGLAAVMPKDKYGYIDKNNVFVIQPQFDAATAFSDGEARVKIGDKWGALYKDGSLRMFK